jgi:excisionase family DNA binding protein
VPKQPLTRTRSLRPASVNDAAEVLGCNPKTIRRYISDGRLTGYRVGPRLVRIDLNEVDSLLRPIPTVDPDSAA